MKNKFALNLRKLRNAIGLTQEQIAKELHISPQAVSKWETGVANPDLDLILPLAKILKVSTDILLGDNSRSERKEELIDKLKSISNWREDGRTARLHIAKDLLLEFPDDSEAFYQYSFALGDHIRYDANEDEKESLLLEQEKYCRLFLEKAPSDRKMGQQAAILSLIDILCQLDRRTEAIELANRQTAENDFQLQCYSRCLVGDEKEIAMLKNTSSKFHELIRALYLVNTEEAFDMIEQLLYLFDPSPNDSHYENLISLHDKKARKYYRDGLYDMVMDEYSKCAELAVLQEEYIKAHPDEEPWYTSPLYRKCLGTKDIYHEHNPHIMVRVFLTTPGNKALFDRSDYKSLCELLKERISNYDPFNEKN